MVPFAALLLGAVSFIFPFAAIKENRVVDGRKISGAALAGPGLGAGALLAGAVVAAAALGVLGAGGAAPAAVSPFGGGVRPGGKAGLLGKAGLRGKAGRPKIISKSSLRTPVYIAAALTAFWLTAALLVRAGSLIGEGAAPRVSPALGFWGLPAASYVLIQHAGIPRGRGRMLALLLGLLLPAALILAGGRGERVSVLVEFSARRGRFLAETLTHLRLFALAVVSAALIGVPLGILASGGKNLAAPLAALVDGVQTIPSMALFGLLMAPLSALSRAVPALRAMGIRGIGAAPALAALTLYAMLPVVRNTIAGLAAVPDAALEAGRGMGMSSRQLFRRVRGPMAMPYVLAGLRTASVQAVGNTAVAALIGAGGLGIMIFQGLGQAAPDLILLGVIPLILMAVGVDRLWDTLIQVWVSPGLRGASGSL